jgi:hypothetical protein
MSDIISLQSPPMRPGASTSPKEGSNVDRTNVATFSIEQLKTGINISTKEPNGSTSVQSGQSLMDANLSSIHDRYRGKTAAEGKSRYGKHNDKTEDEKIAQLQKIKKSAQDYEGLLMNEMIKSMRQSPLTKTTGSDTYSEIAEKPFTELLTAAGGLGLADSIINQVANQEGLTETLKNHPEIMGPDWRPKIAPGLMPRPLNRPLETGPVANQNVSENITEENKAPIPGQTL